MDESALADQHAHNVFRQREDKFSWHWNKQAFPGPLTPLVRSYLPYHTQGWAKAARAQGAPGAVRIRFVDGYFYSVWQPVGLTTWEAAEAAWQEAERTTPARWDQEWLPEIEAEVKRLRAIDLQALADDDLSRLLHEALTRQIRLWEIHAHVGSASPRAVQRLVDWYLERYPGAAESEPYRLLQGQRNSSVESGHRLWELGQMVTPVVAEALRKGDWEQLPEPFRRPFEAYLDAFGRRTQAVADPGSPTWHEDPRPVAELILAYAEGEVPDPYRQVEQLAMEREAFTTKVQSRLGQDERATFEGLLACALANYPLLEDHNYWLDQQCVAAVRDICAEFGRRLVAAGALDRVEDISYLTLEELILWGFGRDDSLSPQVAQRKIEHRANRQVTPADLIGAPPEPESGVDRYSGPASPQDAGVGEVRGIGASAGVARGHARVARTLSEAQMLQPGEVLVAMSPDPNWTPFFGLAVALVTDVGGSLCHAAVVAREYGLPAVVGTHVATERIRNGQMIEVDGASGIVHLMWAGR